MKLRPSVVASISVLATAGMVLTGCGSGSSTASKKPTESSSPSSSASSASSNVCQKLVDGPTSESVKVSGSFGKTQKAAFKSPLQAYDTERTIVKKGSGKPTHAGEQVNTLVTVYLGNGKSLGTQPLTLTVGNSSVPPAFAAGASCLPFGTRSVTTARAQDVYGPQGNPQAGIKPTDSMVIVTDLLSQKKPLVPAAWTNDVPSVTFDSKGKPTVKLPKTKPPKQLELKVLKQGSGTVVKSGDTVNVDYQGISWNTGKIFDQSYGRAPASFATDQVVEGFGAALVGQKVGTRVMVTIPPKYAYGPKGSGQQLGGQTLVFVIDIHSTKAS
ncbi:FKBP-type peptidyl-prolyl cis-trans isomerase [Nocardioides terrisoli]|uniref:FKBP-type peptidyl-prolyl cis-trans isomerase n=1 Tax=Nocardioides terrisoli TaxID=3388267 RepID=UPI00287BC2C2|nr:FKBP-type peptidyl-prolyl cis-trans isomerase [Nocardioides marmorisolisilvae]